MEFTEKGFKISGITILNNIQEKMEIMGEKMGISKEVRKTPKNEPIVNLEIKIAISEKKIHCLNNTKKD